MLHEAIVTYKQGLFYGGTTLTSVAQGNKLPRFVNGRNFYMLVACCALSVQRLNEKPSIEIITSAWAFVHTWNFDLMRTSKNDLLKC